MRSRSELNGRQQLVACWVVGALFIGIASQVRGVVAQELPEPDWRRGVSRWTGSGYAMPAITLPTATSSSTPTAAPLVKPSVPVISEAPYTIPVDPNLLPTTTGMTVLGPAAQTNPYFRLPPSDEMTSLELSSPSDIPGAGEGSNLLLPPRSSEPVPRRIEPLVRQPPLDGVNREDGSVPLPDPIAPPPSKKPQEETNVELIAPVDAEQSPPESMAKQIESETDVEPAPLESEVVHWYQYPRYWMRGWDSHAELGLDGSNGNSRTLAIQTGLETKRKTDLSTLALDFDYRQASNRSTTTEDNGRFNLDYDRLFPDSSWAGFGKFGMEWDKFKAFDLRLWGNAGIGYHWIRTDDTTLVTRFGAGASKEIGAPDDAWIPEAVFGGEAERQLTSRQKLKGKVEYFPAWEDFGNYRIVSDAAWEILLDGRDNLSLKLAATDRYDSTPQGAKKNDIYYSLLLLYKF